MITQAEIGKKLNVFLDGSTSLDDFEDWLIVTSWNMHTDSSDEAQRLAWAIELNLSEYSSNHLDAEELRVALNDLIPMNPGVEIIRRTLIGPDVFLETGSSTVISNFPNSLRPYADMPLAKASE